jgi:hypothetical protein
MRVRFRWFGMGLGKRNSHDFSKDVVRSPSYRMKVNLIEAELELCR